LNPKPRYVPLRVLSSVSPVSSNLHHRASNNWCSLYLEAPLPPKLDSPITPSPEIFHKPVLYKRQSTRLKVSATYLSYKNHTPVSHNVLLRQLRARLPGPLQPAEWPVRQLCHPQSPTSPHTKLLLNIFNPLHIGRNVFSHDLFICFTITPHGCQGSIIDEGTINSRMWLLRLARIYKPSLQSLSPTALYDIYYSERDDSNGFL